MCDSCYDVSHSRHTHLLSHGRQEALRVEEPRHPETVWSSLEHPAPELGVPLQELGEPETNSC